MDAVRVLLEDATAVAEVMRPGNLPLYLACHCGHADIVSMLLGFGAVCESANGYNALNAAIENGSREIRVMRHAERVKWTLFLFFWTGERISIRMI